MSKTIVKTLNLILKFLHTDNTISSILINAKKQFNSVNCALQIIVCIRYFYLQKNIKF